MSSDRSRPVRQARDLDREATIKKVQEDAMVYGAGYLKVTVDQYGDVRFERVHPKAFGEKVQQ